MKKLVGEELKKKLELVKSLEPECLWGWAESWEPGMELCDDGIGYDVSSFPGGSCIR